MLTYNYTVNKNTGYTPYKGYNLIENLIILQVFSQGDDRLFLQIK